MCLCQVQAPAHPAAAGWAGGCVQPLYKKRVSCCSIEGWGAAAKMLKPLLQQRGRCKNAKPWSRENGFLVFFAVFPFGSFGLGWHLQAGINANLNITIITRKFPKPKRVFTRKCNFPCKGGIGSKARFCASARLPPKHPHGVGFECNTLHGN